MKTKFFLLVLLISALLTNQAKAADSNPANASYADAGVLNILEERELKRDNGQKVKQQNLELLILSGPLKGQKHVFQGISEIDVISGNVYKKGDKVLINYGRGDDGKYIFYITDYIRSGSLFYLLLFFIAVVLAIGGFKGLKSLAALLVSFLVIMKILVPLVLAGYSPLIMGLLISLVIASVITYLTDGYNKKSHLAVLSIILSLLVTAALSIIFSGLSRLTGAAQEEVNFLIDAGRRVINFKGLLLASFIIGTLGVLDDVVIGQMEAVRQIKLANPALNSLKVFTMSLAVGKSHLGAIINTLFLAYVGASFPLILLFSLNNPPFLTFSQVINSEAIATEIVRTLIGVVGLCLAVPISSWLGAKYLAAGQN